jgi:hypothetical protein
LIIEPLGFKCSVPINTWFRLKCGLGFGCDYPNDAQTRFEI